MADQSALQPPPPPAVRKKKKFPARKRPPHYGVCPTCQRPWDGVEGSALLLTETKQPTEPIKPTTTAPETSSDIFACPFLPPDLLQPVAKYPRKYMPFVSGQNSSAPTIFTIVAASAVADPAAAAPAQETETMNTNNGGVYDDFADDLY